MTQERLEYFKKRLEEMRDSLLEDIRTETVEEMNPFETDGDVIDEAEVLSTASLVEGLSRTQKRMLEEILKALQRIENGVYGKCIVCGEEIDEERLDAIPYAEKCRKHM
ncbi:TraR/DksA family transcriptional regulator [Thermospira aquatica]|uniref:TraR/DksA family transcriptional regulator n=1 Tax=Thermospira aquatica TaxID=2828656 RepID=A0AAX3BFQ6_9SPIR|nr:TraR/DksA family transcriptional regulator [Thermospira aquatica]URA11130.1 TraR/DksA family transcriptional regulator [Thermospira aquatica]